MKRLSRHLSHEELRSLAFLCGSVALLVAIAVFLSASLANTTNQSSVSAATALGDFQGVPPSYTGHPDPDYTNCWIYLIYGYGSGGHYPVCINNSASPFHTGIFSISPTSATSTGESVYANSTLVAAGYVQGPVLGPAFSTLGCPDGTTLRGNWWNSECDYVTGSTTPSYTYAAPATYCYSDTSSTTMPIKYSFPAGYSLANSDKLDTTGGTSSGGNGSAGWLGHFGGGGQCSAWKWMPTHIASTFSPTGTVPAVDAGGSLTVQWSCLPSRVVNAWGCHPSGSSWSHPFGVSCSESSYTYNALNISSLATGASGNGPNFAPTGLTGSATITAPTTNGIYPYSLTCAGQYNEPPMTIPVNVGGAAVPPTVTITGNGQAGAVSADLGTTTVNVVAAFAPGTGDTLTLTALNGCTTPDKASPDQNCQTPITGVSNTNAVTPKSYAFKPAQPGLYYFYPAVQTQLYFGWSSYGKKLTINAQCASGTHWVAGAGNPGDAASFGGHNANGASGRCVANPPPCPNGLSSVTYPSCVCPGIQVQSGSLCVNPSCPNGLDYSRYPTCACPGGQTASGNSCIPAPPTISLIVAQARVQKGTPAKLSWSVSGLVGDMSIACSVTSNPSGVLSPQVMTLGTKPIWSGTNVPTGNIMGTTIFTLTCTGATSVSKTVTVIPTVIEK